MAQQSFLAADSGSTVLGKLNANVTDLETGRVTETSTNTLTNKSIDGDTNTVTDLAYSAIKSNSRSGLDVTLVTGTKGSTNELVKWNVDGDAVTAGVTTETTLTVSNTKVPTSAAVSTYVASQIGTAKTMFIPVTAGNTLSSAYDTAVGDFATNTPDSTEKVYFNFFVPTNFTSLTSAVIVMIPDTTETVQWDLDANYGAIGQLYNVRTGSVSNSTQAVTINVLAGIDVSPALTSIAANDYVGLRLSSDTTTLRIIGMRFTYA